MKSSLSILLAGIIILLQAAALHAQSSEPDILYLNDGSQIKGTIIEMVRGRTVKIRTEDGTTYVYQMSDVKKMTANPRSAMKVEEPADNAAAAHESEASGMRNSLLFVYGGISVPTGFFAGRFAENTSDGSGEAGAAATGFIIGADADVPVDPSIAGMASLNYAVNSMELPQSLASAGITADAGSWKTFWAMLGVKVFGNVLPNTELFGFAQAGLFMGSTPEINLSIGDGMTQPSSSANAGAYGFGIGFKGDRFCLSLRYLTARPKYQVSAKLGGETLTGDFIQHTNCLFITAGLAF